MRIPAMTVDGPVHAHEVRRDRNVLAGLADGRLLVEEVGEHRVRHEPQVVQGDALKCRVVRPPPVFGQRRRWFDLVPVAEYV